MRIKPPFLFYALAFLLLLASLVYLSGVIQTVLSWNWLLAAGYQPHPIYNVLENLFIFSAFSYATAVLVLRKSWAPRFGQAVVCLAVSWSWFDRIFIGRSQTSWSALLLPAAGSIFILGLMLISLALMQPYMKNIKPADPVMLDPGGKDEHTPS